MSISVVLQSASAHRSKARGSWVLFVSFRLMLDAGDLGRLGMTQGVILLVFIALIVAYVVTRTRRRMGMLVTGRTWLVIMGCVVIGVLALWISQRK